MKNPPHPGLSVRHDCVEPLALTVTDAARRLGVSRKQLSELVNGRSGISPEMAIRLDKAFGGGADTWYRLRSAYNLAQAMKNAGRIHVERIPTSVWRSMWSVDPGSDRQAFITESTTEGSTGQRVRCPDTYLLRDGRRPRPHHQAGPRRETAGRRGGWIWSWA